MNSSDLSSYSLEELTEALRILKNYKVSLRQIGARAVLFDPKDPKPPHIRVEYAPGFEQTTVKAFTKASITKYFPEASLDDKTIFRESNHITG